MVRRKESVMKLLVAEAFRCSAVISFILVRGRHIEAMTCSRGTGVRIVSDKCDKVSLYAGHLREQNLQENQWPQRSRTWLCGWAKMTRGLSGISQCKFTYNFLWITIWPVIPTTRPLTFKTEERKIRLLFWPCRSTCKKLTSYATMWPLRLNFYWVRHVSVIL